MWGYIQNNRRAFFLGLIVSIAFIFLLPKVSPFLFKSQPESIGMVGNYTFSTLPRPIQDELSFGLVKLLPDYSATTGAALSWTATDSGKIFIFNLNPNLTWQDGTKLTSDQINYNLKGVEISRPDAQTVKFVLKEPFAPLVTLLSQPLFKNGLVGLGKNRVTSVQLNGRFLSAITIENVATKHDKVYKFFASEKDLITALRLGSIRKAKGLHEVQNLETDPSYRVDSTIAGNSEAVIFFNTVKQPLEDKAFRQALVYALPDTFAGGETAESPLPKGHWAQTGSAKKYSQNLNLAKSSIQKIASGSAGAKIVLTTSQELSKEAEVIASAWKTAGVDIQVQESDVLPLNFDAYLTLIDLPDDPDQYALWHSTQTGNLTGYKSFKVDKLLEEGRQTIDHDARLETYSAFEKAITEDVPAAFLFYPKVYTVTRAH